MLGVLDATVMPQYNIIVTYRNKTHCAYNYEQNGHSLVVRYYETIHYKHDKYIDTHTIWAPSGHRRTHTHTHTHNIILWAQSGHGYMNKRKLDLVYTG